MALIALPDTSTNNSVRDMTVGKMADIPKPNKMVPIQRNPPVLENTMNRVKTRVAKVS